MIGYNGEKITQSGKGSKPRHRNNKAYKANYDLINWDKPVQRDQKRTNEMHDK